MIVQQFFVNGLAHISYILGGSKTCAVIDPRNRDGTAWEAQKQKFNGLLMSE